ALDSAGGPFAVGLVLAARMLPSLLFGLAAGTLADRVQRNRLLVGVSLTAVPLMLALSGLAGSGRIELWLLAALSFATGCVPVFDVPARQALVMDTVPRAVAANAMALNALAGRLCTALGALAAGALIPTLGVGSCYLVIAFTYATAAALVGFVRPAASGVGRGGHPHKPFSRALS
ncbi:MAG: MFS transporter, partial [Chloroflexi bacterium]